MHRTTLNDFRKIWTKVRIEPRLSDLITASSPTERQGQTGAGRGKLRFQLHGSEYVQVQGGVTSITNVGRLALIFKPNGMIECDMKC